MKNATIRLATKEDIPALYELWKACFHDPDEYIQLFYNENFERITAYIYVVEGIPVCVLHALDAPFSENGECRKVKMLYAGGTLPEYRRHGCMAELMTYVTNDARENGFALFLKPSTPHLVDYYHQFGFEPDSHFRLLTVHPGEKTALSASPLTAEEYNKMRNDAFCNIPYVKWSDEHVRWCVKENEYFSGKTLAVELDEKRYFLMAAPDENELVITETNLSASQLRQLSGALCELFCTDVIKAYMPEALCDEGEKILSSIVFNAPLHSTYVNLILI